MANVVDPADIPLPEFLDPLLLFLSDNLPQSAYSIVISFLSYCLALVSVLSTLLRTLVFDSSNWNAQTLLPPLIALLFAYLLIVSLYRTAAWMLRTTFWFIKWGTLLATVAAGAGWLLGNGGDALEQRGVANTAAGIILDIINNEEKNAARSARSSAGRKRPKAWKSFKDRDWQYSEKQDEKASTDDAQVLMESVFSAARSVIKESNWWGVFDGPAPESKKETSESDSVSR